MIKHITYGMCAFMLAIITHQPVSVQASPNACEFLIASIIKGHEYGHFSAQETEDLIDACARETWGEVE